MITRLLPGSVPPLGTVAWAGVLMPSLEEFLVTTYAAERLPADPAALDRETASRIRAVVTSGRFGVPSTLMRALPNLELVANFGVGYDTTDVAQAAARGILVTNTPDVLTDCVADTALALLLDAFRRFSASERFLRSGAWAANGYPLTRRFSGRTVGIVGLGRIGQAIAERAAGFGCPILYHSRRHVPGSPWEYVPSLRELAERVDALVVAVPGGPATDALVDRTILDAIGPEGVLINIARGSVVDEEALMRALDEGTLGGAGLDVFAHEPDVPAGLLRDDVTVYPHVGSGTVETRQDMRDLVLANLAAHLDGASVLTPVGGTPQD